jgi:enamine deaminase RidA (YjgF/YER057c/UK114 family)
MRQLISSGSELEVVLGYSRAVGTEGYVFVSGTSGLSRGAQGPSAASAYDQFNKAVAKITLALAQAGCSLSDVVFTRVYLVHEEDWSEASRAHGEVFGEIRPASTMIQVSRLIDPEMRVEVEAIAVRTRS